jgi:hypothetical protein
MDWECNDFTAISIHRFEMGGNGNRYFTYDMTHEAHTGHDRRLFGTQSDILCMESYEHQLPNSRPNLVYMGYRNGLVQCYDIRTDDDIQRIGQLTENQSAATQSHHHHSKKKKKKEKNVVDSVLRIQPLFQERPDQLLVRGRTCWSLYDLRCLSSTDGSSSSSGHHNHRRNAAIVQSNSLSPDLNCIPCKGMATDPRQSVIIVPYQKRNHNGDNATSYGVNVWSLDSGKYVGQAPISTTNHSDPTMPSLPPGTLHPSDVELSSMITPAWRRSISSLPPREDNIQHCQTPSRTTNTDAMGVQKTNSTITTTSSNTNTNNTTINENSDAQYSYFSTKSYGLWLKMGSPYGMHHITL